MSKNRGKRSGKRHSSRFTRRDSTVDLIVTDIGGERGYQNYLRSMPWKILREQALHRDGWACVDCGRTDNLHVHHTRYPSVLGTEPVEWLKTLCARCHDLTHFRMAG
jgi:5-methylcytosine-specific restriction endonuclease McrA